MRLPSHRQPIAPFHQERMKAPLEQVPATLVPAIKPNAIAYVQPLAEAAQVALGRLEEQVLMIVHQHPAMDPGTPSFRQFGDPLQNMQAVAVLTENRPPLVAAVRHVITAPGHLNSQRSCQVHRTWGLDVQMSIFKM